MKKSENIIVICAIDNQIENVKNLAKQINFCDVGYATYGNKYCPPSVEMAKLDNFYDSPRQDIPEDREFHCCEMIAYIDISKHFYNQGYKNVYICHHDVILKDNPLPYYEKEMTGKWSFIAPIGYADNGREITLKEAEKLGGFEMKETNLRASHELLILSKEFIAYLNRYDLWEFFKQYDLHSDLTMFDFYPEWNGFKAKIIDSCVIHAWDELNYDIINGRLVIL